MIKLDEQNKNSVIDEKYMDILNSEKEVLDEGLIKNFLKGIGLVAPISLFVTHLNWLIKDFSTFQGFLDDISKKYGLSQKLDFKNIFKNKILSKLFKGESISESDITAIFTNSLMGNGLKIVPAKDENEDEDGDGDGASIRYNKVSRKK